MLRVLELFAGIGACSKALTNLGIDHEIVDAVEIDKFAIQSFNAIHGTNFEPQDITAWDKNIQCDLIMHGSPCQDFSVAGKGAGGDKDSGTRSSLMYETLRIVEKLRPQIVIWENVKNLLSKKHRHNFDAYLDRMSELGYDSTAKIMNAKDYGVPQNRERVFTISVLRGSSLVKQFLWPEPFLLEKRLRDVLEDSVDEKYYLSEEQLAKIRIWENRQIENGRGFRFNVHNEDDIATTNTTSADRPSTSNYVRQVGQMYGFSKEPNPQAGRIYDKDGISPTVDSMRGGNRMPKVIDNDLMGGVQDHIKIKNATKRGYMEAYDGDGVDISFAKSNTRRGRVQHNISQTIPSATPVIGVNDKMRIRKLTPKECWRLMGFADEDFDKAKASGVSNSQLYKQAGNSIVVNVLEEILRNLLLNG